MALYPIRTFGDPVLRLRAKPVTVFDETLRSLVNDMIETMYDAPGVGLAAPQIGVSRAVAVFDAQDDLGPKVIVNPEIVESSGEWEHEEGCLSVPGHYWSIVRPGFVRVKARDVGGREVEYAGDGLLGRVLQHETDHLSGTLLLERLDRATRKQALRELRNEALGLAQLE